jgi:hypothetical protein
MTHCCFRIPAFFESVTFLSGVSMCLPASNAREFSRRNGKKQNRIGFGMRMERLVMGHDARIYEK